jgi:hypothetical protein
MDAMMAAAEAIKAEAGAERFGGQPPRSRDWAEGEGKMTEDDRILLRQIIAAGGRKYTAGSIDRSRYERIVDFGALIATVVNGGDVQYEVTEQGRQAVL